MRQPHFTVEPPEDVSMPRPASPQVVAERSALPMPLRTGYERFEGSPLVPRLSFGSFVVGNTNKLAHAAAHQVAL